MITISDEDLKRVAEDALKVAVSTHILKSGMVQKQIGETVGAMSLEIKPIILKAFQEAAARICADTTFIDDLLKKTILDNADKLTGAFNGALAKAGRELGMDRDTLRGMTEKVKEEIALRNEMLDIGKFS